MKYILIVVYLILTTLGVVFMKLGGNTGTFFIKEGVINININWISAIGFVCYIFSFLLFTRIVIMFELSYIFPICTGIVQILSLIASKFILKENISVQAIIGVSFIIIGILVMNIPKQINSNMVQ